MADLPPPSPDSTALPPVIPPSGRMIAQLFVVPGLIVAGAVSILLGFSWLAGGPRTAAGFLDGLQNSNPEVRWRAASDLAQVLLRDDLLASDVPFSLELTDILHKATAELDQLARTTGEARDRKKFIQKRAEVQYLAASVGNLSVPTAAPVLAELATKTVSGDPKTTALLQRQAVWSLSALGAGRARFDKLPSEKRQAVRAALEQRGAKVDDGGKWAKAALGIIDGTDSAGTIAGLAQCADADDPFLRKQAALALGFWKGSAVENLTAEKALLKLARDDGRGNTIEITDKD
ncbi:MAG: hypothetical protein K1X57_15495 [Gemmataceae bacterium]|nr:hypothetical protein [Gemmataceae bacterium]